MGLWGYGGCGSGGGSSGRVSWSLFSVSECPLPRDPLTPQNGLVTVTTSASSRLVELKPPKWDVRPPHRGTFYNVVRDKIRYLCFSYKVCTVSWRERFRGTSLTSRLQPLNK